MNAFSQYLKIRSNFQNDTKEEKRKGESAQVHYLDELVDVTTHELIRRHAREDLKIFNGESILCPRHRKASIVLNAARRVRAGFLLSLVGHVLLLQVWGDLLYRGYWGSSPHHIRDGGSGSDRDPFLHHTHHPLPKVGKWLILLGPHFGVHILIKFCHHLYERKEGKHLKKIKIKNKKEREKERTTRYDNTHSYLQLL